MQIGGEAEVLCYFMPLDNGTDLLKQPAAQYGDLSVSLQSQKFLFVYTPGGCLMQLNDVVCKFVQRGLPAAALAITLLLTACDRPPGKAPPQMGPAAVSVVTVQTGKVVLTTKLPGRTTACRIAEIRPQVSGLILERLFEEETDVKARNFCRPFLTGTTKCTSIPA